MNGRMKKKFAVVVSSHGEVDAPSISAYYHNIKHIFAHVSEVMPIPKPARLLIPVLGSIIQTVKTKRLGYRSPMNRISAKQTSLISDALKKYPNGEIQPQFDLNVFNAYETTPPYTEDLIRSLAGYDGVVVLPMNPIESAFSCGALCRFALRYFGDNAFQKMRVVTGLWKDEKLIALYRDYVLAQAAASGFVQGGKNALIVALHGTVVADKNGVPVKFHNGLAENQTLFQLFKSALKSDARNPFSLIEPAYLNHQVGGKWTEPTLRQTIERLEHAGTESVAMFAAGYYADNSETEFSAAKDLQQSAFKQKKYIPCMNDSPEFAALMAERIMQTAKGLLARQALGQAAKHSTNVN